jgi:competence protein ComEC
MKGQLVRPELDGVFEDKAECELSGEITMIVEKPLGIALYVKNITIYLKPNEPFLCENVIVSCPDSQNYLVGNHITVCGEIQKFSERSNPGQFNEKLYYQIENIDYKVKAEKISISDSGYSKFHMVLNNIKKKLIQVYTAILPEKESGTLIAMLLGEKYLLDDEIKQLYQENGISHILAISGLHVSLIGFFMFKLLKKLKLPLIPSTIISILFIYSYGVLTNFSVSTNRSVVMMTVMLLSAVFGKTYDMLSSTALSMFLILLKNPLQLFSAGFLLSFGAVLGIAIMIPCFHTLFPSKNRIINSLYVSIGAQAVTLPVILSIFYQFPVYSVVINLLILPCISALVLTAVLAGIVGIIDLPLGIFCIGGANYILKFYEWVCRIGSSLPHNLLTTGKPDNFRLFFYGLFLVIFIWGVKKYQKKAFLILFLMAVALLLLPETRAGLEVTMLDVGQGEAIFIESRSGTTYLIDGGSNNISKVGTYRIQPFLLENGVDRIDYAIVTHSDSDHANGLMELLSGSKITIRRVVLPDTNLRDKAYLEIEALAREKKIELLYIKKGDSFRDGELRMTCLHPAPGYTAKSNNSYSTVLSLSYKEFDMLFTGDLQQDGEELLMQIFGDQKIMENGSNLVPETNTGQEVLQPILDNDVLKVAHHGSKYSTFEDLLNIIRPEYSLISCGKDNFYGHPHKELLDRLVEIGSDIRITYETGAIQIITDGKKMKIRNYLEN